jgi:hypothetical protein
VAFCFRPICIVSKDRSSLIRRSLVQMDLAFWFLHAHFVPLALLAVPTLVAIIGITGGLVLVERAWELSAPLSFALYAIVVPTLVTWVAVFAPLPSAVFAWRCAAGSLPEARECFAFCWKRSGRLARVATRLFFSYLVWFVLLGFPFLFLWARTCAAPAVALFEEDPHIFRRSKRLLKEEMAIHLLAALYLGIFLAVGILVFLPRGFLMAARMMETSTSRWLLAHLWIVELFACGVLASIIAVGWCISMTLLYREIRLVREGEPLREQIAGLQRELLGADRTQLGSVP